MMTTTTTTRTVPRLLQAPVAPDVQASMQALPNKQFTAQTVETVPAVAAAAASPHPKFLVATADDDASIIAALPRSAQELVEAIGFLPTMAVLRSFGGKRVFIPSKLPEDSKLTAALGREVAQALVNAMGGGKLEPPLIGSVERLLRNNAIRSDFDGGATMDELVDRYRMTQRHLRTLLKVSPQTEPKRKPSYRRDPFTIDFFNRVTDQELQGATA